MLTYWIDKVVFFKEIFEALVFEIIEFIEKVDLVLSFFRQEVILVVFF